MTQTSQPVVRIKKLKTLLAVVENAAGHTCTLQKTIIVKPSIPKIIEVAPQ